MDVITIERTGGLGPLRLREREVTAASRLMLEGLGANRELLRGHGLDWGSGSGCLAILATRIPAVESVVGLELDALSVRVARENALLNEVRDRVTFLRADLFEPFPGEARAALDALRGGAEFLVTNPPASAGGDGLDLRRRMLAGALDYLVPGAPVLVQISYQYGLHRIEGLARDVPGYVYEGVAAETGWVPFDQERADLARQLEDYAAEELRGGPAFTFEDSLTAVEALSHRRQSGASPRSKWQLHLYRRTA